MAKTQAQRRGTAPKKHEFMTEADLPSRRNLLIILGGVVTIVIGFLVMSAGGTVDPLSVTIAPIILIIGYCVVIPLGIMLRNKKDASQES
jgi:hypothetical protein